MRVAADIASRVGIGVLRYLRLIAQLTDLCSLTSTCLCTFQTTEKQRQTDRQRPTDKDRQIQIEGYRGRITDVFDFEGRQLITKAKFRGKRGSLLLFVVCKTSQQHAGVSLGRICSVICSCHHHEIEVADQTFHNKIMQQPRQKPLQQGHNRIVL